MIATHSIRVLGRELQVKSSATPEHVAQVEALVNQKLAEANAATNGGDSQMVSILAMLNIAEAYLALKNERDEEQAASRDRLSGLLKRLDWQEAK